MKERKIEKIGSLLFLFILIFMMIIVLFFTKLFNIDFNTSNLSLVGKYKKIYSTVKTSIENNTSENLSNYEKLVEYSYIYNKALKYNLYTNSEESTVNLGNNYFSYIYSEKDVDYFVDGINKFSNYLNDKNINLLYVQIPFKISSDLNLSPVYNDSTDKTVDKFLNNINDNIDHIDLRKNIKEDKLNNLSLFFETDHHWLPETGLWATNIISNYINEKYNLNLMISNLDSDKYNYKKYRNLFLGTAGRHVSLANAELEDFTLITPKFETKLHITINNLGINKIGTYDETLIDWSKLEYGDYYNISPYTAYMYGDQPLIEIHNELVNNNKKILLIKDSFAEVVSPFLSLECEYLSILDLRYYNNSFKKYIEEYKPDIVIVMYNGSMISGILNEHKVLWNFE